MEISKFKQILLDYQLVEDNEYFVKYLQLIEANLYTKKEKGMTQKHHCIPVEYYRQKYQITKEQDTLRDLSKAYANLDSNNIVIYLTHKDHMLAHCYLALCAKSIIMQRNMASSCFYIALNPKYKNLNLQAELRLLDEYDLIYKLLKGINCPKPAKKDDFNYLTKFFSEDEAKEIIDL